jgi:hypothetical protein
MSRRILLDEQTNFAVTILSLLFLKADDNRLGLEIDYPVVFGVVVLQLLLKWLL